MTRGSKGDQAHGTPCKQETCRVGPGCEYRSWAWDDQCKWGKHRSQLQTSQWDPLMQGQVPWGCKLGLNFVTLLNKLYRDNCHHDTLIDLDGDTKHLDESNMHNIQPCASKLSNNILATLSLTPFKHLFVNISPKSLTSKGMRHRMIPVTHPSNVEPHGTLYYNILSPRYSGMAMLHLLPYPGKPHHH